MGPISRLIRIALALALGWNGLAGIAALTSLALSGAVWAAPLTWLTYGLYLGPFATYTLLLLLAVELGTPGCESGVIHELFDRIRSRRDGAAMHSIHWCVGLLHRLDAWGITVRSRQDVHFRVNASKSRPSLSSVAARLAHGQRRTVAVPA